MRCSNTPSILLNMKTLIRLAQSAEARRFCTHPRHLCRKPPERAETCLTGRRQNPGLCSRCPCFRADIRASVQPCRRIYARRSSRRLVGWRKAVTDCAARVYQEPETGCHTKNADSFEILCTSARREPTCAPDSGRFKLVPAYGQQDEGDWVSRWERANLEIGSACCQIDGAVRTIGNVICAWLPLCGCLTSTVRSFHPLTVTGRGVGWRKNGSRAARRAYSMKLLAEFVGRP
ncbi:hypothetical protein OKW36_003127 [Paraburkholderia sp. MM5482-R1]